MSDKPCHGSEPICNKLGARITRLRGNKKELEAEVRQLRADLAAERKRREEAEWRSNNGDEPNPYMHYCEAGWVNHYCGTPAIMGTQSSTDWYEVTCPSCLKAKRSTLSSDLSTAREALRVMGEALRDADVCLYDIARGHIDYDLMEIGKEDMMGMAGIAGETVAKAISHPSVVKAMKEVGG